MPESSDNWKSSPYVKVIWLENLSPSATKIPMLCSTNFRFQEPEQSDPIKLEQCAPKTPWWEHAQYNSRDIYIKGEQGAKDGSGV